MGSTTPNILKNHYMVESTATNALQSFGKHPISGKKGIKKQIP
jgi:hypothetical protein